MKPIADILEDAARLIEKPGAWTQEFYARAADGRWVRHSDESAVCWCVLGAIKKAGDFAEDKDAAEPIRALKKVVRAKYVHCWNDSSRRTQAQVVAKLREAATLARGDTA